MPTVCQQQEAEEEEGCHSYCYLCKCSTALPLATGTRCSPLDACPCCCPFCCCCCCCTVSLITAIRAKECSKGGGSSPSSLMGCTIVLIAQMTRRSRQQAGQAEQAAGSHSLAWMTMKCMHEYSNQMRQHEHTHTHTGRLARQSARLCDRLAICHHTASYNFCIANTCAGPASPFLPFFTLLKSALSGTGQSFKVSRLASTRFIRFVSFTH